MGGWVIIALVRERALRRKSFDSNAKTKRLKKSKALFYKLGTLMSAGQVGVEPQMEEA